MSTTVRPLVLLFVIIAIGCMILFFTTRNQCPMCDGIPKEQGPLIVKAGTTYPLPAGQVHEFTSILIHKGATLEIVGDHPEWTIIKSKGDFRLEGTIKATGYRHPVHKDSLYIVQMKKESLSAKMKALIKGSSTKKRNKLSLADKLANKQLIEGYKVKASLIEVSVDSNFWDKIDSSKWSKYKALLKRKKAFDANPKTPKDSLAKLASSIKKQKEEIVKSFIKKPFTVLYNLETYDEDCTCGCNPTCTNKKLRMASWTFVDFSWSATGPKNVIFQPKESFAREYHAQDTTINLPLVYKYPLDRSGGQGGAGGRMEECKKKSCMKISCFDGKKGVMALGGSGSRGMSVCDINQCRNAKGGCYRCDQEKLNCNRCNDCKTCTTCEDVNECYDCEEDQLSPGKGGAGGTMGGNGGLLYLAACGSFLGENGTVDVSGQKGRPGQPGASNKYTGGGGGGGGPGGNGGMVYFNVQGHLSLPTVNIDGGEGGDGGKGGTPHKKDGLSQFKGKPGKKGQKGAKGKTLIEQSCKPVF